MGWGGMWRGVKSGLTFLEIASVSFSSLQESGQITNVPLSLAGPMLP